ncbi:hypothetical protein AVEN_183006-1 [Araneus ventricosus]|uniref:Uncharacterized protein n=1 Tax=Araneus ventricosus TaxID=182803 RepID=A0A4Y2T4P5_ARAVE|nr:hypothetical protein AVEN_183006-1 [Araneus ventricosus]
MLPPEASTMQGRLHAVPRHRRSAVWRVRSSCVETNENRSVQGPDYTVDDQTAPKRNHPRALEFEWFCGGSHIHGTVHLDINTSQSIVKHRHVSRSTSPDTPSLAIEHIFGSVTVNLSAQALDL